MSVRLPKGRIVRTLVVWTLLCALAVLLPSYDVFAGFRRSAQDVLLVWEGRDDADDRVVVLAIDAKALRAVKPDPFPWPRSRYVEIIERLTEAKVTAVGIDILMDNESDDDAELARALAAGPPAVLAAAPGGLGLTERGVRQALTLAVPAPGIVQQGIISHVNLTEDEADGFARRVPVVLDNPEGDRFIPSMALALAALTNGATPQELAQGVTLRPGPQVQLGPTTVPVQEHHEILIAYSSGIDVISIADVLDGSARTRLEGKTVLVGATDPTLLDRHRTPLVRAGGAPGVTIHANALSTILRSRWLTEESSRNNTAWALALISAVLVITQLGRLRSTLVVTGILFATHIVLFLVRLDDGVVMDPLYPAVFTLLALGSGVGLRYVIETRQRERIASLFGQYVPEGVADILIRHDDDVQATLDGQRLRVAVFFCDLRGFTPISATLPPSDVRRILDIYYLHVCSEILDRGGSVMQFVGDEVFGVFGAPLPFEGIERAAAEAALAVQDLEQRLHEELVAAGLPPVRFGISVHAGEVVAAHVGTDKRRQYSVMGDPVNVGSRICGIADAGAVVISKEIEPFVRDLGRFPAWGGVALKGVAAPVPVWSSGAVRATPVADAGAGPLP